MTQIRYFNAFLLSSLTFVLLYAIYFMMPAQKKIVKPAPSKVIKIALVTPPKKLVKKVVKPVVKKVVKKKLVKKKIIKKKIIKKPKPKPKKVIKKIIKKKRVIKKKVIKKHKPKRVIKKKIIKKKRVEEYVETYVAPAPVYVAPKPTVAPIQRYVPAPKPISQPIVQPTVIKSTPMAQKTPHNNHNKKAFLRNVRSQILANKVYPRIAKRRHIEGSVEVRFDITKSGDVTNIRFINGKSIFQKSIRKTLHQSFPMNIPANVKGELPLFDISVVLHFNIR